MHKIKRKNRPPCFMFSMFMHLVLRKLHVWLHFLKKKKKKGFELFAHSHNNADEIQRKRDRSHNWHGSFYDYIFSSWNWSTLTIIIFSMQVRFKYPSSTMHVEHQNWFRQSTSSIYEQIWNKNKAIGNSDTVIHWTSIYSWMYRHAKLKRSENS